MYEIVMTSGDRAECETIAACLTAAATLAEDSGWGASVEIVNGDEGSHAITSALRLVANRHVREVRP